MNKAKTIILLVVLLLTGRVALAQEPASPDSVVVTGTVVDHLTNEPQPFSLLHFFRGTDTAATVRCDDEGCFVNRLAVGEYTLSVTLDGQQVYQADLVLNDNAALHIAVITDTFTFRNLKPAEITALRHMLGAQRIASPSDIRIWNLTMRKGGGDHSAAVSISPDMMPEEDELDSANGVLRLLLPVGIPGKAYKFYLSDYGLNVSADNSTMKNELLSKGRILDTRRIEKTASDTTRHEKK